MKKQEITTAQVEATQSEATQSEATQTDATQVDATQSEATQSEATQTDATQTVDPIQDKARAVLAAKLPNLNAANLNFEKRSGSFFRATLVHETEKDADGNDVIGKDSKPVYKYENNKPVERIARLVVNVDNADAPEYLADIAESCAEEMKQKRAAAFVQQAEKIAKTLREKREEILSKLSAINSELQAMDARYADSVAIVEAVVLPERSASQRVALSAKVNSLEDENAKLRAMLIAAGIEM